MGHDIFDWVNLAAAVATAVFTGGGVVWGVFLYRGEVKRREAEAEEAKRAQANVVTASFRRPGDGDAAEVTVRNASDQPISDVTLSIFDEDGRNGMYDLGMLPAGEDRAATVNIYPDVALAGNLAPFPFWFSDAHGRRWFRDWDGRLHHYPDYGEPTPAWWMELAERARRLQSTG